MTRNTKDNYLVIVLFSISISMIATICSTDALETNTSQVMSTQADITRNSGYSENTVNMIGISKITKSKLF